MDHFVIYALSGLLVGFIVGLTGVGGGSLMTPILVYLGVPPLNAVGTDLLYASITKAGGVAVYARKKSIDWKVVGFLSLGSLPAAGLTLLLLAVLRVSTENSGALIKAILGAALVASSLAMFLRQFLARRGLKHEQKTERKPARRGWCSCSTVGIGIVLGILVSLSSVGAGAIGAATLIFLYPHLPTSRIVGIDLAHAVPLTLVAGLGHLALGNVNLVLLGSLLVGSLPGIWLGSFLAPKMPDRVLRPAMAGMLAIIGGTMFWVGR